MASKVELLLNFPRTELVKDGWAKSRLASAMKPSTFNPVTGKFESSTMPRNFWREPNKGVIMLRPTPLGAKYWEDDTLEDAKLKLDKWHYLESPTGATGLLQVHYDGSIQVRRADSSSALIEILVTIALQAVIATAESAMTWVMQTKDPLAVNEGFSVWVHPPGIYTERATDYMMIAFGLKYVLHLRMNGTASLWSNAGTSAQPNWIERVQFKYSGGGVDHGKPFQITVIPWGFSYITFMFSQSSEPEKLVNAGVKNPSQSNSFLYDINAYEPGTGFNFDPGLNQYIKTKAAPLSVALRGFLWQYGFAFAKIRYPLSESLTLTAEQLPEPLDVANPTIQTRGFAGQKFPGATDTALTNTYTNHENQAWDKDVDTQLVNHFVFQSNSNKLYTPELWSLDMEIPEKTHTPDWTEDDVSARWTYLRFQRTVDADVSTGEFKLERDDLANIMKGWGPVRMKVDTLPVFDGYIFQRQPVIETRHGMGGGSYPIVTTQYSCRDLWVRLNEKLVSDYKFLDGLNLLETMQALIRKAGFASADIEVDDPDGHLASLSFEGFQDPNDQKGINQDGTVGDVLRDILKNFSLLPIRVRVVGDKWKIYLAPQYDPELPPELKLYLRSEGMEDLEVEEEEGSPPARRRKTDTERWTDHQYYGLTNPEFTLEEPEFNGLIGRASQGSDEGAEGVQAVIPATKVDSDSVTNEDSFWFMGRAKVKVVAPPEITMVQSQEELNKATRIYWDRFSKHKAVMEVLGEWQPEIDVDDFFWVIGIDDEGERCSFGAWRIDSIDVELHSDFRDESGNPDYDYLENADPDMRYTFQANYTLIYVGVAEDEDTPMFTEVLPPE